MVKKDKFVDKRGDITTRQLTLYLDVKMHEKLKELSSKKRLSMNDLGREGLEYVINKYKVD